MFSSLEEKLNHLNSAIILWGCGWECRKWQYQRNPILQWKSPHSTIWYSEKTALQIAKVEALEQLQEK